MTDKELKKLSREQLLEMLLAQTREVNRLQQELDSARQQLQDRTIRIRESGSIAEASLKLTSVFQEAQKAADQYLYNVKTQEEQTAQRCRQMEAETRASCEKMVREARAEAASFWNAIRREINDPLLDHQRWLQILNILEGKPGSGR